MKTVGDQGQGVSQKGSSTISVGCTFSTWYSTPVIILLGYLRFPQYTKSLTLHDILQINGLMITLELLINCYWPYWSPFLCWIVYTSCASALTSAWNNGLRRLWAGVSPKFYSDLIYETEINTLASASITGTDTHPWVQPNVKVWPDWQLYCLRTIWQHMYRFWQFSRRTVLP